MTKFEVLALKYYWKRVELEYWMTEFSIEINLAILAGRIKLNVD